MPGAVGGDAEFDVQEYVADLEQQNGRLKGDVARLAKLVLLSPDDADWRTRLLTSCPGADDDTEEPAPASPVNGSPLIVPTPTPGDVRKLVRERRESALKREADSLRRQLAAARATFAAARSQTRSAQQRRMAFLTGGTPPAPAPGSIPDSARLAAETEEQRRAACEQAFAAVRMSADKLYEQSSLHAAAVARAEAAQAAVVASETARDLALAAQAASEAERDAARAELAETKDALSRAQDYGKRRNEDCVRLQQEVHEKERKLVDEVRLSTRQQTELELSKSRFERLEQRLLTAREEGAKAAKEDAARIAAELDRSRDMQLRVDELLAATTREKDSALKEIESLEKKLEEAADTLSREKTSSEQRREEEVALKTARGEAERELQVYRQVTHEKEAELVRKDFERTTLLAELATIRARFEEADQKVGMLEEEAKAAHHTRGELTALRDRCADLDDRVQVLMRQNARLELDARQAEGAAAESKEKLAAAQAELESERSTRVEAVAAAEHRCDELTSRTSEEVSKIRGLEEENLELRAELRDMQEIAVQSKEQVQILGEQVDDWDRHAEEQLIILDQLEEWELGVEDASFEKMIEGSTEARVPGQGGQEGILRVLAQSTARLKRWQEYLEDRKDDPAMQQRREPSTLLKTMCKVCMLRLTLNQYSEALVKQQQMTAQMQQQSEVSAPKEMPTPRPPPQATAPKRSGPFGLFRKGSSAH